MPRTTFLCASCRSILGDTAHFVAFSETYKWIALHAATPAVAVDATTHVAPDGSFTYRNLRCTGDAHIPTSAPSTSTSTSAPSTPGVKSVTCGAVVGRVYVSTNTALDLVRESFCLDVAATVAHRWGHARTLNGEAVAVDQHHTGGGGGGGPPPREGGGDGTSGPLGARVLALEAMVQELQGTNTEIQSLVLVHQDYIAELQAAVGLPQVAIPTPGLELHTEEELDQIRHSAAALRGGGGKLAA